MRKSDNTSVISLMNGVTTHLNMLGALIKYWICCDMNHTSVICMKRSGRTLSETKFNQQSTKPNDLRTGSMHYSIFRLCRRFGNHVMFLTFQRDKCTTKKHAPSCGRGTGICTSCIIGITITNQIKCSASRK